MISRYTRPEFERLWSDRNKYLVWLKVELAVCDELAREGRIPAEDWATLKKKSEELIRKGGVDPKRVEEIEKKVRHDVIAFTTACSEIIGPTARYIHFGLTSSDVLDTSLSLQIMEAGELLKKDIQDLVKVLKQKAEEYQQLPTIGRSHGISAEPTSFGLKFLGWFTEWKRNLNRLEIALENMRFGKLSGAVGVNAHLSPQTEEKILKKLGLNREPVSTQVLPRDRHAEFLSVLAICGGSLERIAVELRHLQRSEVGEVFESFTPGQKGSSAMPHKKNPISSENITGCARLLRAYSQAGLEDIALWHERDISHSSVERVVLPDATTLLDYAMGRSIEVLKGLQVVEGKVRDNLDAAGPQVFSGHFLLALVEKGVSRENAYEWVQECALKSKNRQSSEFLDSLASHPQIKKHLPKKMIEELGSTKYQLRNVRTIFQKA
jgi:adenylosuccinate lyase